MQASNLSQTEIQTSIEKLDTYCSGLMADLLEIPTDKRAGVIQSETWAKDRMASLERAYANLESLRAMAA